MKVKKRISSLFLSVAILSSISMVTPAHASEITPKSDISLANEVGISQEAVAHFSEEKKAMYSDLEILDVESAIKYYRIDTLQLTDMPTNSTPSTSTLSDQQQQYFIEISQDEYETAKQTNGNLNISTPNLVNPDSVTTAWCEVETSVKRAIRSGDYIAYMLEMNVEIIGNEMGGLFRTDYDGFIAGGLNSHCSPISGSEYLYQVLTPSFGVGTEENYYDDAPHKGNGYGFEYGIGYMAATCTLEMGFLFEAFDSTSIIDAYGFFGYWDTIFLGSISIDINGPSISISPAENLIKAPDTHAQMRP